VEDAAERGSRQDTSQGQKARRRVVRSYSCGFWIAIG